jgi:hypothetical protein
MLLSCVGAQSARYLAPSFPPAETNPRSSRIPCVDEMTSEILTILDAEAVPKVGG